MIAVLPKTLPADSAAVLFGARLFGLMGAILCVPIMAVLYTLIGEWVNNRLEEKRAIAQRDEK